MSALLEAAARLDVESFLDEPETDEPVCKIVPAVTAPAKYASPFDDDPVVIWCFRIGYALLGLCVAILIWMIWACWPESRTYG
jgi:hypothetical protein